MQLAIKALFSCVIILLAVSAQAQDATTRIFRHVYYDGDFIISAQTNEGRIQKIRLYGLEPIDENDAPLRIGLYDIIQEKPIFCKFKQQAQIPTAQCVNHNERDIALNLISSGYAMMSRSILNDEVFSNTYLSAEEDARRQRKGYWAEIYKQEDTVQSDIKNQNPVALAPIFEDHNLILLVFSIVAGPVLGMLFGSIFISLGFGRLLKLQKRAFMLAEKRYISSSKKERSVFTSSILSEVKLNQSKTNAFITVYKELLNNIRNAETEPKYKKNGDIIHTGPALTRAIYDNQHEKLELLHSQIINDITELYTEIEPEPDYKTIEPDTPEEDVIALISGIVTNAEKLSAKMEKVRTALEVISAPKDNN